MDEQVVVDGNLVSSRKPDDIPAFNASMIDLFAHAHDRSLPDDLGPSLNTFPQGLASGPSFISSTSMACEDIWNIVHLVPPGREGFTLLARGLGLSRIVIEDLQLRLCSKASTLG